MSASYSSNVFEQLQNHYFMKKIISFLFCLGFFNGFAQPNIDALNANIQAAQRFVSLKLETNSSLGISYYAIVPPVFETYTDTIFKAKKNVTLPSDIKSNPRYLELKPAFYTFKQLTIDDEEAVLYLYEQGVLEFEFLFLVKEFTTSEYMTYNEYEDNSFNEAILIERQRLVSKSSVQQLKSKNEIVHPKQVVFEVDNGNWSEFRTHKHLQNGKNMILEIQKALNKKGYPCKIDGVLDGNTRAAWIKFERDNNIPQCGIVHLETFKLLGIPGY